MQANELMCGVQNLCIGAGNSRYDPRRMVELVLAGLRLDAGRTGTRPGQTVPSSSKS